MGLGVGFFHQQAIIINFRGGTFSVFVIFWLLQDHFDGILAIFGQYEAPWPIFDFCRAQMTPRPPNHVDALKAISRDSQKSIQSSPKRLPNPILHSYPPKKNTFLRYCKGPSDPKATLPCWCCQMKDISTQKSTFSLLFGVSETNKIKPEKASKQLFYPVIPQN